ncbi:MAG: hypothetical protein PVI90_11910 [Desulfobacteraceae bacterium]|jgi:hypothetical protein
MNSSNFPINFSTQKSTEGKLAELHRSVTQIWNRINRGDAAYNELAVKITEILDNIDIVIARVNTVNTHTSAMPDTLGFNADHDRRYITRSEVDYRDTKRVAASDSPYTVVLNDEAIFCDTDAGPITVNLPAGKNGLEYRIINCGSSGNDVTITPDGSEYIDGAGASKTLADGLAATLCYEPTEGWW